MGSRRSLFGKAVTFSADIDLSTLNAFGIAVSDAGDVNGDGIDDVIVGARAARTQAGVAYILFGQNHATAVYTDVGLLTFTSGSVVIHGAASEDFSGYSVSGAGDVNGDGSADVLVAVYGTYPLGRSGAGVLTC